MELFRIAKKKYLRDLSGTGARLYGGRWNHTGHSMVYCASTLALCVLEVLVHLDIKFIDSSFGYIQLSISEDKVHDQTENILLLEGWRSHPAPEFTRDIGSEWLQTNTSVGLRVPSAVLPQATNILLNPNHPDFRSVSIVKVGELNIDHRVFK